MDEPDGSDPGPTDDRADAAAPAEDGAGASTREDIRELFVELGELREELESVESGMDDLEGEIDGVEAEVEGRTVHRDEIEADLERYVRRRLRRGHARGWGPYLVLLYGTAMTIGAFYLLSGGWAILAMIVIWLSTLGLYTLMVLVGVGIDALSAPGRLVDAIRERRP